MIIKFSPRIAVLVAAVLVALNIMVIGMAGVYALTDWGR